MGLICKYQKTVVKTKNCPKSWVPAVIIASLKKNSNALKNLLKPDFFFSIETIENIGFKSGIITLLIKINNQ